MMKYFLFLLTIFYLKTGKTEDLANWANQEALRAAKEYRIKDLAKSVPELKGCVKQSFEESQSCYQQVVSKIPPEKLVALSKQLNLVKSSLISSERPEEIAQYFSQKFSQAFFAFIQNNQQFSHLDHGEFLSVYKSMVGNHILMNISQYCLAHHNNEDTEQADKVANLSQLASAIEDNPNAFSKHYIPCINELKNLCDNKENIKFDDAKERQGCLTYLRLKNYKSVLARLDDSIEQWNTLRQDPHFLTEAMAPSVLDYNELTHISSTEVKKQLEKSPNPQSDIEQLQELKSAYYLQQQIQMKKVENLAADELRTWAKKNQSLTEEQINEMSEDEIKKIIKKRYQVEGKALIKEIQARINRIENSEETQNHREMASQVGDINHKAETIDALLQYHNIASSFLCLGKDCSSQEEGGRRNNLAPLQKEISDLENRINQDELQWIRSLESRGQVRNPANERERVTVELQTLTEWLKRPSGND